MNQMQPMGPGFGQPVHGQPMMQMQYPQLMPPSGVGGGKLVSFSFGLLTFVFHAILLALFCFAQYDFTYFAETDSSSIYNYYVGVAMMMFVGFGYLMTFLKAYGLGAVGFTMFITCMGVEYALFIENFMASGSPIKIDFLALLNANFAVAAVLISFGALIGKIGPSQVLVVVVLELTFYSANKIFFLTKFLAIADCGGTIIIHVFGAYFGLACSATLGPAKDEKLNGSSYNSDLFSLIGTVFLWLFWPSFVAGALPPGQGQTTALINTILALVASTITTFALTPILSQGRMATVPVQNATLAGGVAIGATANLALQPKGALIIGTLAGALSTFGFISIPIPSKWDTCGIHNLHGMPGVLGGLISAVVPLFIPAPRFKPLTQIVGLVGTMVVALVSGALTGAVLGGVTRDAPDFDDGAYWEAADDKPDHKDA